IMLCIHYFSSNTAYMATAARILLFQMVVGVLAALAFIGLYLTSKNPYAANAGWAVLALLSLEGRVRGGDELDERDQLVMSRSMLIGYRVFWIAFTVGCAAVPFVIAPAMTVAAS